MCSFFPAGLSFSLFQKVIQQKYEHAPSSAPSLHNGPAKI